LEGSIALGDRKNKIAPHTTIKVRGEAA